MFFKRTNLKNTNENTEMSLSDEETIQSYKCDYIQPISTQDISTFLHENKLEVISPDATLCAGLFESINQLPGILSNNKSGSLYKIVIPPEHTTGTLMKLNAGGSSTTIIENNKIVGQAQLYKVTNTAQQITSNIFSVASVVTGMYYMKTITNQLANTERLLNGVKKWLEYDKQAEISEAMNALQVIYNEFSLVQENPVIRKNNIMQLRNINRMIKKNILFYNLQLKNKIEELNKVKDYPNIVQKNIDDIKNYILLLKQLNTMLGVETILETTYEGNYNDKYIKIKKDEYIKFSNMIIAIFPKLQTAVNTYIENRKTTVAEKSKFTLTPETGGALLVDIAFSLFSKTHIACSIDAAKQSYIENKSKKVKAESKKFENAIGGFSVKEDVNYLELIDKVTSINSGKSGIIVSEKGIYLLKE